MTSTKNGMVSLTPTFDLSHGHYLSSRILTVFSFSLGSTSIFTPSNPPGRSQQSQHLGLMKMVPVPRLPATRPVQMILSLPIRRNLSSPTILTTVLIVLHQAKPMSSLHNVCSKKSNSATAAHPTATTSPPQPLNLVASKADTPAAPLLLL